jgi:hypothetical protein
VGERSCLNLPDDECRAVAVALNSPDGAGIALA